MVNSVGIDDNGKGSPPEPLARTARSPVKRNLWAMLTQIYGVTTADDALAVDQLGPDHVGIVLDEGIPTWDNVDEATAQAIVQSIRNARVVALSLATTRERILATCQVMRPAIVHLARAYQMGSEALSQLRGDLEPTQLMLTVPVVGEESITEARRLAPLGDFLLLDSSHPSTGIVGATGLVHDWDLSERIVSCVGCPVFLAGGLGADNVADAIRRVRPAGVDSETRTSRVDDRRRKDLGLVEEFLATARAGTP
jgi:phosphoribosylanthranilate isomerase